MKRIVRPGIPVAAMVGVIDSGTLASDATGRIVAFVGRPAKNVKIRCNGSMPKGRLRPPPTTRTAGHRELERSGNHSRHSKMTAYIVAAHDVGATRARRRHTP